MRLWVHTQDPRANNLCGFLDVTPDSVAQALITEGLAQPAEVGGNHLLPVTPPGDPAWHGNGAFVASTPAPTVTTAPVIAGNTAQGSVLTCTPGVYTGAPVITRQWRRGAADIAGQTGLTYLTTATDVGNAITCRETATNAGGSISSDSNAITVV